MGDVRDFRNFMGAVIDAQRLRQASRGYIERAHAAADVEIVAGGTLRRLRGLLRATHDRAVVEDPELRD